MANRAEMLLTWYLRILGIVMMTAVFAVVMPFEWMDALSGWLTGWGLQNTPVNQYVARGLSMMYVFFGAMVFRLSYTPSKHLEIVKFMGQVGLIFAVAMIGIDLAVGLPWLWVATEGPVLVPVNLLLLYLVRRVWAES